MQSVERDVRLLILAMTAGSADAWSYVGLGHVFVANMTGNTVLLGIAVFQNHGDLLHPAISLLCYAAGALLGSALAEDLDPSADWPKAISWALMVEALLLLGAQAGWMTAQFHARYAPSLNLLLGAMALAIGVQSGAMVQLKIPGIVTTYITGTWTTMLSGLVRLVRRERPARETRESEQRVFLQAAVLSAYFLSAVLTGWLFRYHAAAVGALPALGLLLVAAHGVLRG